MKITRKFLVILLCLTLCIVPLPFSVYAYDTADDMIMLLSDYSEPVNCPRCNGEYAVSITGTTYTEPIGTYDKCIGSYYTGVRMECVDCHFKKPNMMYYMLHHSTRR